MDVISNTRHLTVGLVQMTCGEKPGQNLEAAMAGVREAAARGARVICLPELFRTQYFCQEEDAGHFKWAETIPGPSTEALSRLAAELETVLIVPLFEKRSEGLYHNSAVVLDADGGLVGRYRKMHIPDDPGFYEKFYFTPGDTGFKTFQTRYCRVGVLICWDQWFPEAARLTALAGADILFYPTAIGFQDADRDAARGQAAAWETVQRGHAIANGVYLAAVNRTGRETDIFFWGKSFLCDPFGEILARAPGDKPDILVEKCDLARIEETRQAWPFLRDRRVDAYKNLSRLFLDDPP